MRFHPHTPRVQVQQAGKPDSQCRCCIIKRVLSQSISTPDHETPNTCKFLACKEIKAPTAERQKARQIYREWQLFCANRRSDASSVRGRANAPAPKRIRAYLSAPNGNCKLSQRFSRKWLLSQHTSWNLLLVPVAMLKVQRGVEVCHRRWQVDLLEIVAAIVVGKSNFWKLCLLSQRASRPSGNRGNRGRLVWLIYNEAEHWE